MNGPNTWTLEKAKNGLSEVVRRALNHQPQLVVRGGRADESVVVIARSDYERLVAPMDLVGFLRASPLAEAVAEGAFGADGDPFPRQPDAPRDSPL